MYRRLSPRNQCLLFLSFCISKGTGYTRFSPPCLFDRPTVSVLCEIIKKKNFWNHHVGVTYCEASDQCPGHSFKKGSHHRPLTDARCILQHTWRHCLLYHSWRYKNSIREVLYDVATAISDLADPTKVRITSSTAKES